MADLMGPAREQAQRELEKLIPLGIRNDNTLFLKRYPLDTNELSMVPADNTYGPSPITPLEVKAAEIKLFSGFGFLALAEGFGGSIQVGDHKLKFVRTAAVEAFLKTCLLPSSEAPGGPYPEMEYVIFELNGEDYQAVRWLPGNIFLEVYIRKLAHNGN